jgi:DNA-binding IclR family transcriptional regulator
MTEKANRTIDSVKRSVDLIKHMQSRAGATVTELADAVDLAPGTVHTHLATLKEEGLVYKKDGAYHLSPSFIIVAEHVRNQNSLYSAGWAEVDKLAEMTGEKTHLVIEHNGLGVTVYEVFGDQTTGKKFFRRERENPQRLLHYTSSGKAILAHLPEERVDEIVDEYGLPGLTDQTVTTRDELDEELEQIREEGIAFNHEEQMKGVRAVSAPIFDQNGDIVGAVGVGGPASRFKGEQYNEAIPEKVRDTANLIEVNLRTGDYIQ